MKTVIQDVVVLDARNASAEAIADIVAVRDVVLLLLSERTAPLFSHVKCEDVVSMWVVPEDEMCIRDRSMIGLTGDDADGEALRRSLAGAGVDTAFVGRCGEPTGTAFICVSDAGENNIVVHAGANACVDARALAEADACLRAAEMCCLLYTSRCV